MQIYLEKLHENYIINVLINVDTEKNFLSQKLIKKKEIYIKIIKVNAHTINNYIFIIYKQALCKIHVTNFEEIRYISIYIYLITNITNYNKYLNNYKLRK